ncbi:MAG: hypothetical protein KJ583_02230 [Nanoarchaeota archaeon]|nr:hypothetical protein [Nanoarchaeota archaeon]MBU1269523.1 hypothetical protein [Nanoarchaeota archaeon]MBU1604112.1 hypothetical protein [Nanoarchaeota archaeon]MBU2442818.1 hypothetical protein [Nanoarchaeota archaeon]
MSLMPEYNDAEIFRNQELDRWKVPKGLDGIVVKNLDELRKRLPSDETYGGIFLSQKNEGYKSGEYGPGFNRYSRPLKKYPRLSVDAAYNCNNCDNIIIGAPKISAVNNIGPLSGREGIDYVCGNCETVMSEKTIKQS